METTREELTTIQEEQHIFKIQTDLGGTVVHPMRQTWYDEPTTTAPTGPNITAQLQAIAQSSDASIGGETIETWFLFTFLIVLPILYFLYYYFTSGQMIFSYGGVRITFVFS